MIKHLNEVVAFVLFVLLHQHVRLQIVEDILLRLETLLLELINNSLLKSLVALLSNADNIFHQLSVNRVSYVISFFAGLQRNKIILLVG